VRELHESDGLRFLEVYLNTPLEECERRDPKGLYARARAGALRDLTGGDAPYESPAAADLTIRTTDEPVERSVRRLMAALGAVAAGSG
jgi:adenylylsulfate kinase-like enzyme